MEQNPQRHSFNRHKAVEWANGFIPTWNRERNAFTRRVEKPVAEIKEED